MRIIVQSPGAPQRAIVTDGDAAFRELRKLAGAEADADAVELDEGHVAVLGAKSNTFPEFQTIVAELTTYKFVTVRLDRTARTKSWF
jgi:hypothetical protein